MKILLIALVLALTGCATAVPVKRTFPEAPAILLKECPNLQSVSEEAKLSDILSTVTQNYSKYHECQYLMSRWHEWYQIQKIIFDSAN